MKLATAIIGTATAFAASGIFEIDGKKFELTNVYARKAPSTFEKNEESLYILAVDRALPLDVRTDDGAVRGMVWDDKLNGIELEIKGDSVSWMLKTSAAGGSVSGSRSPNPYKLQVTATRVKGRVEMNERESSHTKYYVAFDVDAAIERFVEPPPPSAADTAAAQGHAATKAYFAFQAALMKGDKATMIKLIDPEKAKMMDTPEFPAMIKFIQEMQAKNIKVLKVAEKDDAATLTVVGDAGKQKGTATMARQNGQWILMKESWQNAK
ncbi:MAG: hypothetical protein ACKV2U_29230 [Bryobacteraceae bacterium]